MKTSHYIGIIVGAILKVLLCLFAIALFLSYATPLLGIRHNWLSTLMGLCFLPLFFINIFIFFVAILFKTKFVFINLLSLVFAFFYFGLFFQFNKQKTIPNKQNEIKILTYNTAQLYFEIDNRQKQLKQIGTYINAQNPDIVCLQEFPFDLVGVDMQEVIKQNFPNYDYKYYFSHSFSGNIILTKYKILGFGHVKLSNTPNIIFYIDILVKDKKIRVYNCHLESYSIKPKEEIYNIEKNKKILISLIRKMKYKINKRKNQVNLLKEELETIDYPSIIVGDFNETPFSYTYQSLVKTHKDSFIEAGKYWGSSYSFLYPMIRIDYILYPPNINVLSHEVLYPNYSDHFPVISTFSIN